MVLALSRCAEPSEGRTPRRCAGHGLVQQRSTRQPRGSRRGCARCAVWCHAREADGTAGASDCGQGGHVAAPAGFRRSCCRCRILGGRRCCGGRPRGGRGGRCRVFRRGRPSGAAFAGCIRGAVFHRTTGVCVRGLALARLGVQGPLEAVLGVAHGIECAPYLFDRFRRDCPLHRAHRVGRAPHTPRDQHPLQHPHGRRMPAWPEVGQVGTSASPGVRQAKLAPRATMSFTVRPFWNSPMAVISQAPAARRIRHMKTPVEASAPERSKRTSSVRSPSSSRQ
jgi:hypothetical protein